MSWACLCSNTPSRHTRCIIGNRIFHPPSPSPLPSLNGLERPRKGTSLFLFVSSGESYTRFPILGPRHPKCNMAQTFMMWDKLMGTYKVHAPLCTLILPLVWKPIFILPFGLVSEFHITVRPGTGFRSTVSEFWGLDTHTCMHTHTRTHTQTHTHTHVHTHIHTYTIYVGVLIWSFGIQLEEGWIMRELVAAQCLPIPTYSCVDNFLS
jgi:hypothetical protein